MAQVTVSGGISAGSTKTGADRVTSVDDAFLKFSASEDLGNGLKASGYFSVEGMNNRGRTDAVTTATGSSANGDAFVKNGPTNTDSAISLSGGFGSIAVTNTRSTNLAASGNVFGASASKGFYDTVASRPDVQVVSYTSPALIPGLNVSLGQALVGNTATSQAAKIGIVGVSYSAGPLSLGVQQKSYNTAALASGDEDTQTEGFLTYDAGVAKVGLGYGSKTTTTGKAVNSFGISVPMGAITLGADYAKRDAAEFTNYGVRYAFSKRTALHLTAGKYQTTATNSKNQSRIRISHAF
jgi:hypothetical protein